MVFKEKKFKKWGFVYKLDFVNGKIKNGVE